MFEPVGARRESRSRGQSFTTSSDDADLCSLGEAQSGNGYFGNGGQADVIGHCASLDEDPGGEVGGWPTHTAMLKWRVMLAAVAESSQNLTGTQRGRMRPGIGLWW